MARATAAAKTEKTGVDDFLVAGGTVAELKILARPFDPADFARERLSRDERLRGALEERREYLRNMPLKTMGQNTRAGVVRVLTDEAGKSGELVEGGVRVVVARRTLAHRAARSLKSVQKAIEYLETEERTLRRDNAGRQSEKAGAFVLFTGSALGKQYGELDSGRGGEGEEESLSKASLHSGVLPNAHSAPQDPAVPSLRWAKVILYWERKDGRRVVADSHYVWRLGEKRGQILRHTLEAGDVGMFVPLEELMARFAGERTRARDFERRMLAPLTGWRYGKNRLTGKAEEFEVGPPLMEIVELDGERGVRVLPGWRENLERYREEYDEIKDAERQAERYAENSRNFRRRHENPADESPTPLMGKERVRLIVEQRNAEDERERAAEKREMTRKAEEFVRDTLSRLGHVRRGLLEDLWGESGGTGFYLRRAFHNLKCSMVPFAEYPGELFVYPPKDGFDLSPEPERNALAAVIPMSQLVPEASVPLETAPNDDWRDHPLACECEACSHPEPRYARPWSRATT